MNFTGSVITGLLYVLPGILFVSGLTKLFSTRAPSPFDGQLSTGIILSIPAALLMHAIGIGAAHFIAWVFDSDVRPNVAHALALLLGDPKSQATIDAVASAGNHWFQIALYFFSLGIFAFWAGKEANDSDLVRWPRRRADWYDLLRHKAAFIWLTTDMQIGGVAYLFAGMLKDFRISSEGQLERVVLLGGVRRTLKRPTDVEMASDEEDYQPGGWIPIPGEFVVLEMKNANTVNVDYWYLEQETDDDPPSLLLPPPAESV